MKQTTRPRPLHSLSLSWRRLLLAPLAAVIALGVACGGEDAEPVASLTVEPDRAELSYGTFQDLQISWSPTAALDGLEGRARVFLHLLDAENDLVRTYDQDLPGEWRAGSEMAHEARIYQSLLAPPLPPGEYTLTAGLYDGAGHRWAVGGVGERVADREYRVATIDVPSEAAPVPAVSFSPSWTPTQAGADRQVVAFRSLTGEGVVTLSDLSGGGTLWLEMRVPPDGVGGLRRRIVDPPEGGDGMPRVEVSAPGCGGFEAQVSGEGSHRVDVPVTVLDGDASCEIVVRPNFVMESPNGGHRSINLEVLAWSNESGG